MRERVSSFPPDAYLRSPQVSPSYFRDVGSIFLTELFARRIQMMTTFRMMIVLRMTIMLRMMILPPQMHLIPSHHSVNPVLESIRLASQPSYGCCSQIAFFIPSLGFYGTDFYSYAVRPLTRPWKLVYFAFKTLVEW